MQSLIKALNNGETVVYPTETLYALGCDGTNAEACDKVISIKARAADKPLPLIIGGVDMLGLVTNDRPAVLQQLASSFWPGPLSILVKALPSLPSALSDEQGYTSVRWSGHPFASELSKRMRKPVVATSANMSGRPPAALPEDLDPELLALAGAAYLDPPWPKGGKASTVIRVLEFNRLEVIREGAVSVKMLCDKGFSVSIARVE
ncbi:threonylcarbamoyl-AMP synthase [Pseudodesulfovibrio cashew]|uniref:L-threonylcarbamoyladenylate synthase n=1 Tax=Pseudodesulfovibrio cashew TaxID=2678688 RepID=A0A6I6JHS5_9BACT|nr:threonylcarbamoyl-AMP synthase [Pseudodesulfovibrio cashew]